MSAGNNLKNQFKSVKSIPRIIYCYFTGPYSLYIPMLSVPNNLNSFVLRKSGCSHWTVICTYGNRQQDGINDAFQRCCIVRIVAFCAHEGRLKNVPTLPILQKFPLIEMHWCICKEKTIGRLIHLISN